MDDSPDLTTGVRRGAGPYAGSKPALGWHSYAVSRLRRANLAQRVVVVLALAALLALVGLYIANDGFSQRGGGWFGYTPLSDQIYLGNGGLDPFPRLLVWAAIVIVWALIAFWIFGLPSHDGGGGGGGGGGANGDN